MKKKKTAVNGKYEFSVSLAEVTTQGRISADLSQDKVAKMTAIDKRTIMAMENGEGNPTLDTLYRVLRLYGADPRPIIYSGFLSHTPVRESLRFLLETCTENEVEALIPIMRAILAALRTKDSGAL